MQYKYVGAVVLMALCSAGAMAHAIVTKSSPAQDAQVSSAPREVTITFNEKVEKLFSTATLADGSGAAISTPKAKIDPANPAVLRLAVPVLGSGKYLVKWTAVGGDGHRRTGDIRFTVK